ncbi:MAG: CGNR zinc finger domain-containing protein [Aestuariivirgaceae bacterium]
MKPKSRPVKSLHKAGSFAWQDHHFINRLPALDFANTVVYRNRPARRDDRLTTLADLEKWRRSAMAGLGPSRGSLKHVLKVRETIDRFFRQTADGPPMPAADFRRLIGLYARHGPAEALEKTSMGIKLRRASHPAGRPSLLAGILQSAVELAFSPELDRVKTCPACGWLFIDRTRNRSKRWCITALCGNRSKMHRHYRRRRSRTSKSP